MLSNVTVTGCPSSALVVTVKVTWYGDPAWLARSPTGASTPLSAGCVAVIVGFEMSHVGGVVGQFTVTVDCTLHAAVLGYWIDSTLCTEAESCTSKVAAPFVTVEASSRVVPLLNSCTAVPSGALLVMLTIVLNPFPQFMSSSSATVNVAPSVGAVNAVV